MKKSIISQSQSSSSRIFDSQIGEEMNDTMENVQVSVRIRGLNPREQDSLQTICVLKDDLIKGRLTIGHTNNVLVQDLKEFYYDQVFGPNDSQQTLFENVGKQMALACLSGYNVCIFAYGQTGAGKTFTMMGNEEDKGLIQRILNFIFAKMKSRKQEFVIQSQYYEIYMEEIIDLYQPQKNKNVRVIEDFNGVRVENLSTVQITNHQQAVELIQKGQKNRHIGATRMNAESSRSHSIFSMTINLKDRDPSTGVVKERSSKLHFVDLAGSERQKQTQATGQRLKEAAQINQSLSTLGIVIHALAEGQKKICYRNSKLTHILKDSLGGNSKTLMIANVSPSQDSYGETLSTLKFAERAKYIKNRALINEKPSENLENLKKEIESLKDELQGAIKNNKLQQELINSYNIKKNEISNSPLISQEAQNSPSLTVEDKQILIKSVDEFQIWLREFLKESGFLDFIQELRQRMGININDMMCVESARDVDSQQWSSLFQVPVENLKEYIKTIMEFNKYTGMITGQYDIDLKNKNDQLNSQIHLMKEELIKKDLYMLDCRNSIINEMKAQSQIIGADQKDQTIAELKSMLDQYQVENNQHLNSISQMEEDIQRKDESISNLHQKITNLLNEIQRLKKKNSIVDLEQKEINENLLKINEQNEIKIKQLQNEIDNLQMQNVSLQEELESEQHKYFMQKEEYESKQEKTSTLHQTIQYQLKLIEDLQKQIAEENKQIILIYKNFSIEKEIQGVPPYSNLWKFIQNTVTDLGCEKDQKNSLIEEIQGMCLHESSLLRAKSEQILKLNQETQIKREEAKIQMSNMIQIPENQIEQQKQEIKKMPIVNMFENIQKDSNQVKINVQTVLNKEYLTEYIQIQSQQLITWNILGKQVSDQAIKENYTNFNASPQVNKQEEQSKNKNNKYNIKEIPKIKSQSEIRYGSNSKQFQQAQTNPQQKQQKEFNLGEKQKVDAILQLIQDNKVLCEGLILKIDEAEKLKQDVKIAKEEIFKIKLEYEGNIGKYQEKFQQNQNQLNQQLSQIISLDILKQNLEEEIINLKEENQYIKQVLADNTQRMEELTREKDQVEDSNFFYELQSKKFQDRLTSIQAENDEQKQQIKQQCNILTSNKKQIQDLQKELSNTQSKLIESNQKIIQFQSSYQSNKKSCDCQLVKSFSNQSIKQNLNQKFQTVSPAHKNYNDKNQSNSEGNSESQISPLHVKKINMEQNNQQSENQNSNKLDLTKQGNTSDSSEFFSAFSSFSKVEAFSQKASQPVSYQNSCNQELNQTKSKPINCLSEKESVQKQLNFNFSNENHLQNSNQSAQFSFFVNIKQDQQQKNESQPLLQKGNQNQKQILQNNSIIDQKKLILQNNQASIINQNSEKKQIKQQMHENKQKVNNQLNSLNPLQIIKQFEQMQKQSSSQSLSNNNISSNQSLPDNINTKKKRSFLQLLDQIEEDESENKFCQIDLMQTMYSNADHQLVNNQNDNKSKLNQSEDDDEDEDDNDDIEMIQKMFNLKNHANKKRFNEQDQQKYS